MSRLHRAGTGKPNLPSYGLTIFARYCHGSPQTPSVPNRPMHKPVYSARCNRQRMVLLVIGYILLSSTVTVVGAILNLLSSIFQYRTPIICPRIQELNCEAIGVGASGMPLSAYVSFFFRWFSDFIQGLIFHQSEGLFGGDFFKKKPGFL